MKDILKAIILDFQESEIETGIKRRIRLDILPKKATVCIGVRRSGKSTFMYQIIDKLLKKGVPKENILYLNFFDDRLYFLHQEKLDLILDAYFSLYPEKKNSEKIYCFFDEIQALSDWEPFVERLMRTEKCEVYITGSSAHMLSKEIATQMRGRALSWEIFPFSFCEFLDYKKITFQQNLSTKQTHRIQKAFDEYWLSGGFPETLGVHKNLRIKIHQEYLQAILFRDLVERHDISHPKAISDLAHWLINNVASLYSINRLTGYLKSLGHKSPKTAVSNYLDWFEDAYFLFTVRMFDASLKRSHINAKKIYSIDHAFIRSINSGVLVNSGHLLENLVFTALRPFNSSIYYYKTKTGKEVDFIVPKPKRHSLIQVSETLADPQTRKRELAALKEAMTELDIPTGTIVTRNESQQIEHNNQIIEIIPIWRFLLNLFFEHQE